MKKRNKLERAKVLHARTEAERATPERLAELTEMERKGTLDGYLKGKLARYMKTGIWLAVLLIVITRG